MTTGLWLGILIYVNKKVVQEFASLHAACNQESQHMLDTQFVENIAV